VKPWLMVISVLAAGTAIGWMSGYMAPHRPTAGVTRVTAPTTESISIRQGGKFVPGKLPKGNVKLSVRAAVLGTPAPASDRTPQGATWLILDGKWVVIDWYDRPKGASDTLCPVCLEAATSSAPQGKVDGTDVTLYRCNRKLRHECGDAVIWAEWTGGIRWVP